jgi:uncharacterized hydrophobic protein (TIGR00271 family)
MPDADSLTRELEDSNDAMLGYDWSRLDFSRLLEPRVLRRLIGMGVAIVMIAWPDRTVLILGRLIGVGLIWYGTTTLWSHRRSRPVRWVGLVSSLVTLGLGLFMVALPSETEVALGRILGVLLISTGIVRLIETVRHRRRSDLGWGVASAILLTAAGGLVALFPAQLMSTLIVVTAVTWTTAELLSISVLLHPDRKTDTPATTPELVAQWFADRPKTVDDRQQLYRELLYEGDTAQTRTIRFGILMTFAAVIAAAGVIADSTAVVIGAMLIAPLMTPLMGMALSLAMGWPNRLRQSSLVALTGIALAIGVGFIIGLADFGNIDTLANGQIVSRASPTIIDVVIAIAAGAAGAYGWSRPDVSNSLPGVGVAIALVPPLSVVGLSYSQGDFDSGNGALLLFVINAIAILVAGATVFLLTGIAPLTRARDNQHRVRTALAAVGVGATLIIGALLVSGTGVATNAFEQNAVADAVDDWIEPFEGHSIVRASISEDLVSVVLTGPTLNTDPSADSLADDLSADLGRDITVDLRILLETRDVSGG